MFINLTDIRNRPVGESISDLLQKVYQRLQNSAQTVRQAMLTTTRNHFTTIYPGSKHYDPQKVTDGPVTTGTNPSAAINIDVPGITRAYHDLNINPIGHKYLTIPMHRSAYGKKAGDFNDLFFLKNKNGNAFLAQNNGGALTLMYHLAEHVHQPQESKLMPSEKTFASNIWARLKQSLDHMPRI